jgi:hypothetical protein
MINDRGFDSVHHQLTYLRGLEVKHPRQLNKGTWPLFLELA